MKDSKNKWDFIVFLIVETLAVLVTGGIALTRVLTDLLAPSFGPWLNHAYNQHISAVAIVISDSFLFFGVAALTVTQASQVSRNITTNELANVTTSEDQEVSLEIHMIIVVRRTALNS